MAPPASKVRVLVTGHTGLAKSKALDRLCAYITQVHKASAGFYRAEEKIHMKPFLDADPEKQRDRWRESVRASVDQWEVEQPEYAFLSLHLSYQRYSRVLLPMSWVVHLRQEKGDPIPEQSLFKHVRDRFQPDYFISLIDDVPFVQTRIQQSGEFRMPLRQLLTWRELEVHLTDFFAQDLKRPKQLSNDFYPYGQSFVVAVQHPPQMLYRLVGSPSTVRIYASYPITSTRVRPEFREEIDRFRYGLHEEFTVFDPLTIDETVIRNMAKNDAQLDLLPRQDFRELRWPMKDTLSPGMDQPVHINSDEARDVLAKLDEGVSSIIEDQIETRDFRLIAQSDCVVAYRPQFRTGDEPRDDFSGGTAQEWELAGRMERPRILIHDPAADGKLSDRAFHSKGRTPYKFDRIGNLSDPENQKKVLGDVIAYIKRESATLTQYRSGR